MQLKKLLIAALTAVTVMMIAATPVRADDEHSHCYDFFGRCACGHYCMALDHSRPENYYCYGYPCYYYPGYPVMYMPAPLMPYVPVAVPVAPVPAIAPVPVPVATTPVTMTNGAAVYPVACTLSNPRDAANQVMTANATAAMLGLKKVSTGTTYDLNVATDYRATGATQTIRFPMAASGLNATSNVYVVYWNGIYKTTRTLPVVVDALGYGIFTVPNMTGTTIVTFFTCK